MCCIYKVSGTGISLQFIYINEGLWWLWLYMMWSSTDNAVDNKAQALRLIGVLFFFIWENRRIAFSVSLRRAHLLMGFNLEFGREERILVAYVLGAMFFCVLLWCTSEWRDGQIYLYIYLRAHLNTIFFRSVVVLMRVLYFSEPARPRPIAEVRELLLGCATKPSKHVHWTNGLCVYIMHITYICRHIRIDCGFGFFFCVFTTKFLHEIALSG